MISIYKDRSTVFLIIIGLLLCISFCLNITQTYDDLYLPDRFNGLIEKYGSIKASFLIFIGIDLPAEYRTYGISRLLQFFIWLAFGGESIAYPLFIATSQLITGICLLLLLRELKIDEPTSLAVSAIWLISPFSSTWCFHHYTYLILPFQIIVIGCLVLVKFSDRWYASLIIVILGSVCALTGEFQILSAIFALFAISFVYRNRRMMVISLITTAAIFVSLTIHRLLWHNFSADLTIAQRFSPVITVPSRELIWRFIESSNSIYPLILGQVREILGNGVVWAILSGIVVSVLFGMAILDRGGWSGSGKWLISFRGSAKPSREVLLAAALFVFSLLILMIYIAISVFSGQVSETMPRRYGYIPVTLLISTVIIVCSIIFECFRVNKRLILSIGVGLVAALAGQMHLGVIPAARAADKTVINLSEKANEKQNSGRSGKKGILFFVSADPQTPILKVNADTLGLMLNSKIGRELRESPFSYFWTSHLYSMNFLGFKFTGIPTFAIDDNLVQFVDPKSSNNSNITKYDSFIVAANLSIDPSDSSVSSIKIFDSFDDFKPHFFYKSIDRDVLIERYKKSGEITFDLGLVQSTSFSTDNIVPDKRIQDQSPFENSFWISNYGLISGTDSTYSHPNIPGNMAYYRTNRHGEFTYGIQFREIDAVEISLDFWEQWGCQVGERVFELEVSWDDISWAPVGKIDPAKINGRKPFSIILTRSKPKAFLFRFTQVAGTKEIPMIQGIRVARIQ